MMNVLPVSRTQSWLARGAIVALIALLVVLKVSRLEVSVANKGEVTTYSSPLVLPMVSGVQGLLVGVLAVVFWLQQGRVFRLFSMVAAAIALYTLFNAPTEINQQLVVTPHSFRLRLGSWYAPVETRVEFDSLAYLGVGQEPDGAYRVRGITKTGTQLSVPLCDLLRKALPEVFRRAGQCGVVIGEGADGLQIPAALRE